MDAPADAPRPTFWITTWGCQMNVLDAERTSGLLKAAGFGPAGSPWLADVVLYMTCSVREKAEVKVDHALAGLAAHKRRNPGLVVGVLGCVAEQEGAAILDRSPVADLVVGPRQLERLPDLVAKVRRERIRELATGFQELGYEPTAIDRAPGVQARVTIMEGCDFRCTFCVVPNTRGPEACRAPGAILEEVRGLAGKGYREVLLLGQTVNAYRYGGTPFPELLRLLATHAGVPRLKFVSSHPLHFSRELAAAIAELPAVAKWVNLPVQSGSDRVLRRMKRLYTRDGYLDRVRLLRDACPGAGVNTDVIVGFPGETEADFLETLDLLEQAQFDSMFSFKYSPRPRTPALRLPDDVPDEEKTRRLAALNEKQGEIQRRRHARLVGSVAEVLVDEDMGAGTVRGRTPCQRIVSFPGDASAIGTTVLVRLAAAGVHGLAGEPLPRTTGAPSSWNPRAAQV